MMKNTGYLSLVATLVAWLAAGVLSGCLSPTGALVGQGSLPAVESAPAVQGDLEEDMVRAPDTDEQMAYQERAVPEPTPEDVAAEGDEVVSAAGSETWDSAAVQNSDTMPIDKGSLGAPGQVAGQGAGDGDESVWGQDQPAEEARQAPGGGPGYGPDTVFIEAVSAGWSVYEDDQVGFRIAYPPSYVIMPSRTDVVAQPAPVVQVLFQDRQVAGSDVAAFAPPAFSIRAFRNDSGLSVAEWLVANRFTSEAGARSLQTHVVGGVPAWRYCRAQQIAPNCMIYLARAGLVVELVPDGEYADAMLASFRLRQ